MLTLAADPRDNDFLYAQLGSRFFQSVDILIHEMSCLPRAFETSWRTRIHTWITKQMQCLTTIGGIGISIE
jgi:hypothetical protein